MVIHLLKWSMSTISLDMRPGTARSFQLFPTCDLEKAPVVDSRKTIHVGKLLHAIKVVRVLDRRRRRGPPRFQRFERHRDQMRLPGAVQRQQPSFSPKIIEWTHISIAFPQSRLCSLPRFDVVFRSRFLPESGSRRQPLSPGRESIPCQVRCKPASSPHPQAVAFSQQHGCVVNANKSINSRKHCDSSSRSSTCVVFLATALMASSCLVRRRSRNTAGIFQRHGCLRLKTAEQVNLLKSK